MAKAKNSTTPPSLTRRGFFLIGAAVTPMTLAPAFSHGPTAAEETDPILTLWRQWWEADAEEATFDKQWNKLETQLFRDPGPPRVALPAGEDDAPIEYASSRDKIDDVLGDAPEAEALRARLHAELTSQQARWDEAATAVQLDVVEANLEAATARAGHLRDAIFHTSARNLAGVATKLALVIVYGQTSDKDKEFPWPELRGALADLRRLAAIPDPQ